MKPIPWFMFFIGLITFWNFKSHHPKANPYDEILLGKKLFFDSILSLDNSISCASCHKPQFAFADSTRFSLGINNQLSTRNTPSIMNITARSTLFWDGRSKSLENQVLHPITNTKEMNMNLKTLTKRLKNDKGYLELFKKTYHAKPSITLMVKAIVAFEKSLETADTPFDRYMNGDSNAISNDAKLGQVIFNEKGQCFECHFTPDFTGDEFKNIGLYDGSKNADEGRGEITKQNKDKGSFKVPGLRNVSKTAPYMHDGRFKSLQEVINYYNNPDANFPNSINRDSLIKPLSLSELEKYQLLEFLKTLTSKSLQ